MRLLAYFSGTISKAQKGVKKKPSALDSSEMFEVNKEKN